MAKDVSVVIVAGGSGSRMTGDDVPKQFQMLGMYPVVLWAARFFLVHPSVLEVVMVVPAGWENKARAMCKEADLEDSIRVITGSVRRQDSVMAGVKTVSATAAIVAIHDGARPFPPTNFEDAVSAARETGAAIFALPATDAIKSVADHTIERTVPRSSLWAAQTPQIFERELLIEALEYCDNAALEISDDASALEALGRPVRVIPGSRLNIKITFPEDRILAEAIARERTHE